MVQFREATKADLPRLISLLADDALGATRETVEETPAPEYQSAFDAIAGDRNNALVVAELEGEVVGMMQLTFIPGLSHRGAWRALIESVRIASTHRGKGIGRVMIDWAIARAKERRCSIVQLTTDKTRPDALRFYESLGFSATHEGMKLKLPR